MKEIKLTEAEMKLMQLLWDHHPRTMTELHAQLEPETHWSKVTVCTLLTRMQAKGTITADESGRVKRYSPAVPKEAVAGEQTDALLREMYGGSVSLLVSNLVERGQVTKREIEQMMEILKQAQS